MEQHTTSMFSSARNLMPNIDVPKELFWEGTFFDEERNSKSRERTLTPIVDRRELLESAVFIH